MRRTFSLHLTDKCRTECGFCAHWTPRVPIIRCRGRAKKESERKGIHTELLFIHVHHSHWVSCTCVLLQIIAWPNWYFLLAKPQCVRFEARESNRHGRGRRATKILTISSYFYDFLSLPSASDRSASSKARACTFRLFRHFCFWPCCGPWLIAFERTHSGSLSLVCWRCGFDWRQSGKWQRKHFEAGRERPDRTTLRCTENEYAFKWYTHLLNITPPSLSDRTDAQS